LEQVRKKNCSNSSVASGGKCNVINASKPKRKPHEVLKQETVVLVLNERTPLSGQTSRSVPASRSAETETRFDNL
jgi:hypothetical protein